MVNALHFVLEAGYQVNKSDYVAKGMSLEMLTETWMQLTCPVINAPRFFVIVKLYVRLVNTMCKLTNIPFFLYKLYSEEIKVN